MNNFGSGFSRWFLRFAPKSRGIRISDSFFESRKLLPFMQVAQIWLPVLSKLRSNETHDIVQISPVMALYFSSDNWSAAGEKIDIIV